MTPEAVAQVYALLGEERGHLSAEALRWTAQVAAGVDPRLGGGWGIRHRLTSQLVGLCLYSGAQAADAVEISYVVAPAWRRRGVCSEALPAAVETLFTRLETRLVVADVAHGNVASLRILERLGFCGEIDPSAPITVGLDRQPAVRMLLTQEAWRDGVSVVGPAAQASGGSRR